MQSLLIFARADPTRTALTLVCLLLAGAAEGFSVASAVPLIALADDPATAGSASRVGLGAQIVAAARVLGVQPTVGVLLVLVAAGLLLRSGLILLANRQVGYTVAHVATDLRLALLRALVRSRWEYFLHQPLGAVAAAVATEARRAAQAYLHATTVIALLVQASVYVIVAAFVSWRATAVTLVAAASIAALLTGLIRSARRAGRRQTTATRALLQRLTDALQSVKPLKAMGQDTLVAPLLEAETLRLNRAVRREVASKEAMQALQDPLMITFLAVGVYVAQSRWSLPLPTVILLAVVCGRIIAVLGQAQKARQHLAASASALWSLRASIDAAETAAERQTGDTEPCLQRAVALRDVRFAYDGAAVLEAASLVVPAGELTAIIGPSGAGKTTVADLIIGLLQPQSGAVTIDDVPLPLCDAQRWRARIGYVPQETFLLHDSIAVNVTLGDPDLGAADVEAALRAADAWDLVQALPEGIDGVIGERGQRLSGGQRQRIALARALVHHPQLLILDEATAALDAPTELEICRTLEHLRGTLTILAICHRGPLIDLADRVYRVDAGRITTVRAGT